MALFRLMWRPFLLFAVVTWVAVCAMWPLSELSDAGLPARAISDGDTTPAARKALWYAVLLIPLSIGMLAGACRIELQRMALSWMLPGTRRGLLTGTLLVAIPVAGVHALVMSRITSAVGAFAAFSLALFWFLLPGYWLDPAVRASSRWLAVILVANLLLFVQYRAAVAAPFLIGLLVLPFCAEMLSAITSPVIARRRLDRVQRTGRARWFSGPEADARRPWGVGLATDRAWPWLRAAAHEAVRRYPYPHLLYATIAVVAARWLNEPLVIAWGGTFLTNPHLQLRRDLLYPLSRTRRARIAHVGSVVDALTYATLTAALLLVTTWIHLPLLVIASTDPVSPLGWAFAPVAVVLFAPIAQWYALRNPMMHRSLDVPRVLGKAMPPALLFVLLAGSSIQLLADPDRSLEASLPIMTVTAVLGLATQLLHWRALRDHFARTDLIGNA